MDQKQLSDALVALLKSLNAIKAAVSASNFWVIIPSVASAIFTAIAAWAAWRSVKQVEKTRKDDFMPVVIIRGAQVNSSLYLNDGSATVEAIFENLGKGVAKNVRIVGTNGSPIFTKSIVFPSGIPSRRLLILGRYSIQVRHVKRKTSHFIYCMRTFTKENIKLLQGFPLGQMSRRFFLPASLLNQ